MAEDDPEFITSHEYYAHREKQDTDIRRQFGSQASLIENVNRQLRDDLNATFNDRLSSVNGTLSGKLRDLQNEVGKVKQELRDLKDEVGQVKDEVGQVKDEVGQVKDEVGQVKDEVGQVKDEVGQVKDEVGEIKARLNRMEGRSFNSSRFLAWHDITPIGIYKPNIGFRLPEYFPAKIRHFWNLQFPSQEKNLIYLIRFYDIQNYQYWGQADDGYDLISNTGRISSGAPDLQSDLDDPDNLSRPDSVEEAVRKYPHMALDELGSHIGLDLERIRSFYSRAAQQNQIQSSAIKRRSEVEAPKIEAVKRVRNEEPQQMSIPLHLLTRPPTRSPTRSLSDRVMWDVEGTEQARANLMAKMNAARSLSTGTSKDSTTDAIPSDEVRHFGGSKNGSSKGQ